MSEQKYYPKLYATREQMMSEVIRPGWNICEIGVFRGDFALTLLRSLPAELLLIDPWTPGICSSGDADGNNVVDVDMDATFKSLPAALRVPPVCLARDYSQNVLPIFPDGHFDMIYIDGDHSYQGAARDLELAYVKTKMYGLICGHDYETNPLKTSNLYDFGVGAAVNHFLQRHPELSLDAKALDGCVSFAIQKRPARAPSSDMRPAVL